MKWNLEGTEKIPGLTNCPTRISQTFAKARYSTSCSLFWHILFSTSFAKSENKFSKQVFDTNIWSGVYLSPSFLATNWFLKRPSHFYHTWKSIFRFKSSQPLMCQRSKLMFPETGSWLAWPWNDFNLSRPVDLGLYLTDVFGLDICAVVWFPIMLSLLLVLRYSFVSNSSLCNKINLLVVIIRRVGWLRLFYRRIYLGHHHGFLLYTCKMMPKIIIPPFCRVFSLRVRSWKPAFSGNVKLLRPIHRVSNCRIFWILAFYQSPTKV